MQIEICVRVGEACALPRLPCPLPCSLARVPRTHRGFIPHTVHTSAMAKDSKSKSSVSSASSGAKPRSSKGKSGRSARPPRPRAEEVVSREYTVNVHKRIHGVYVHASQRRQMRLVVPVPCASCSSFAHVCLSAAVLCMAVNDMRVPSTCLHARVHRCINICDGSIHSTFKKRAPRAIESIREFAKRTMGTEDVRIDTLLNKFIWSKGVRNVPNRVRVRLHRKRNEDEEASEKLYTHVTHVNVPTFAGLLTKAVKDE